MQSWPRSWHAATPMRRPTRQANRCNSTCWYLSIRRHPAKHDRCAPPGGGGTPAWSNNRLGRTNGGDARRRAPKGSVPISRRPGFPLPASLSQASGCGEAFGPRCRREIMLERQREGIAMAKAAGRQRPPGRHRRGADQAAEGYVGSCCDRAPSRYCPEFSLPRADRQRGVYE